ncbi:carbon-nitrogen hydrolase family protein [Psychromicrobium lacuslunae]|uniref:Nitrilase n=1 Tax=Psychromicrobium lacuslunae TaxID=1618207 RepID=A0A0D4C3G6_9MICC|nr:carbon-nitrogen hydrolase family protein [Psychromicrobium lacuslunae]AJT43133.1 nitrilase [Psychromicrobium lacuslunae]
MALKIAALQTAGTPGDVAANLAELSVAAQRASQSGAELLITPELFLTGYNIGDLTYQLAGQDLLTEARQIAAGEGIAIVLGVPEQAGQQIYNTAVFIDDNGAILGRHRKTHLFGGLDRKYFTPGETLVSVVEFRGVKIAMLICYDVEFPESTRAAAAAGAQLIAVPTAQMTPYEFVAEEVIRARAWENQVYLAYVNHAGSEAELNYVGRSRIVDPFAQVLDSVATETALLFAEVDPSVVTRAQRENPYLLDRRLDLY